MNDVLSWQLIEKSMSCHSDEYSFFVLLEILALIALVKQKLPNRLLYVKEYIEIVLAVLLIIADLSHATRSVIGLYAETLILALFFIANVGACFIHSRKRETPQT